MASNNNETKITFKVFNQEFNDGLSKMRNESITLRKEFKLQEEQLKQTGSETDILKAKVQYLGREQELARQRVQATAQQLEMAKKAFGDNSEGANKLAKQLLDARIAEQRLTNEITGTNKKINEQEKEFKKAGAQAKEFGKSVAAGMGVAGTATAAAAGGIVTSMQEYNQDLARLRTNAKMSGRDLALVEQAFIKITEVTGESDSAVETVSNLLATGFTDNQLSAVIDQVNGAAIKFSDTLKTEGIADGIQETFSTGAAVGPFAELLDRSGVKLGDFNKGLQDAKAKGEGANYILQTLSQQGFGGIYQKYKELNPEVQKNAEANAQLQKSLADLAVVLTPLVVKVTEIVTNLVNWANANPQLATAITIIMGVVGPLITFIGFLAGAITNLMPVITMLWGWLSQLGTVFSIVRYAILALSGPVGWIIAAITAIIAVVIWAYQKFDWFRNGVNGVFMQIQLIIQTVMAVAMGILKMFFQFMTSNFSGAGETVKGIIKSMVNFVLSSIRNLSLFGVGQDVINGLINGIGSKITALKNKIIEVTSAITGKVKSLLGIASPSKVMIEMGKWTGEGLAQGIERMKGTVANAASILADSAIPNIPVPGVGSINQGTIQTGVENAAYLNQTIQNNITVVSELDGYEVARNQYEYINSMLGSDSQMGAFIKGIK